MYLQTYVGTKNVEDYVPTMKNCYFYFRKKNYLFSFLLSKVWKFNNGRK